MITNFANKCNASLLVVWYFPMILGAFRVEYWSVSWGIRRILIRVSMRLTTIHEKSSQMSAYWCCKYPYALSIKPHSFFWCYLPKPWLKYHLSYFSNSFRDHKSEPIQHLTSFPTSSEPSHFLLNEWLFCKVSYKIIHRN